MSEIDKESVQAAIDKAQTVLEPAIDEAKTQIEASAQRKVWPLLAGALVIGAAIGGVAGWLLG